MNFKIFSFLLAATSLSSVHAERVVTSLDGPWNFLKDQTEKLEGTRLDLQKQNWQQVTVPHDWAISGPFDPDVSGRTGKLPWQGVGFYWKEISIPASAQLGDVYLDFDGVMASPEVYINGKKIGGWDYGYMSFRVKATDAVHFGEKNDLVVRADTRNHHSRWYPGAGIYRSVRMVFVPKVQIAHQATSITTPEVNKEKATVRISTEIVNKEETTVQTSISIAIFNPKGNEVSRYTFPTAPIASGKKMLLSHDFVIEDPMLWDIESPNLYSAQISTDAQGQTDSEKTRFGIRTFSFLPDDGFHLNGRRVQIQGVDLHSDMGILGMAFNRSVMRRQLEIMKDMGANALRTSHNPPAPEVLELCDEMGIVVWNECFDKWEGTSGRTPEQNLEEYVKRNLKSFVLRDRNHPSVFIWSIGNEIPPANGPQHPGMTRARCSAFRDAIRQFDTTRPVAIGSCHPNAVDRRIFEDLDLTGWNYQGMYTRMRKKYPNKPILYSESASALSSYGYYNFPLPHYKTDFAVQDFEVSSYDHNAAPWSDIPDIEFKRMERDTYCGGEFVWTGIDYLGEPTPYVHGFKETQKFPEREMARSSYFGIVDLTGIPKDRFYLYRSHWNRTAETIHILPHWNWAGREGQLVPVYVYTSGDSAELFLNGKSLGKRTKGTPPQIENLAKGMPTTVSGFEHSANQNNPGSHAVDGNLNTRWCAPNEKPGAWWQVDLQKPTDFIEINPIFESSSENYSFSILLSTDGKSWKTLLKKELGKKYVPTFQPKTARYIKILFHETTPNHWASIREVFITTEPSMQAEAPYYKVLDNYRLRWLNVLYEPGELKVVAYKNGEKLGEKVMRTAGKAERILLSPEKLTLPADGKTVVFVQVDVVDARGTRDPLATNRIHFSLTGPGKILAVGNGNPRGYDVFTETSSHPLYFGKAVIALCRNEGEDGPIILSATAEGLETAVIHFQE